MATRSSSDRARFETIDWDAVESSGGLVTRRTALFLLSVTAVFALLLYDAFVVAPEPLFHNVGLQEGLQDPFTWDVRGIDWLFVLSLLVFGFYVLLPLATDLDRAKRYAAELRKNKSATFALGYLVFFFVFGVVGTIIVGRPSTRVSKTSQPPVSFATPLGRIDLFTLLVLASVSLLAAWVLLAKFDRDRELAAIAPITGAIARFGLVALLVATPLAVLFSVFPVASPTVAAGAGVLAGVLAVGRWAASTDLGLGGETLRGLGVVGAAVAVLFLAGFGLVQTVLYGFLGFDPLATGVVATTCKGAAAVSGGCYGSWAEPLGTNRWGKSMLKLVFDGMRIALQVALISSVLIVPIATLTGTVAGYVGGVVDDLLMSYVDIQQTVPAIVVYMITVHVFGRSLFVLVLVFGLLSWGGAARLVRSEVLQRREEDYITAAESAGAGTFRIMFHHILPNVSNTVLTSVTRQIPQLILAEAAIAFLNLNNIMLISWGETINIALKFLPDGWWMSTIPVVFLAVTVLSFSVLGDALRDVLDPRGGA
ncbi:ABC transporter permease [Haloarchaeobius amylolyticus]|uniref:ABC transporter permease n=1 Tax=Haloarchaeobius amylolyticus TaxID=1198296 RepID=UPI00226FD65B|nr:ABC transporter permease [Haloarchaeobius amylolyticus]